MMLCVGKVFAGLVEGKFDCCWVYDLGPVATMLLKLPLNLATLM